MKKLLVGFMAGLLMLCFSGFASAANFTLDFDHTGDFSLTGFRTQASDDTILSLTNLGGNTPSGDLLTAPAGTYDWWVTFDSLALDFLPAHPTLGKIALGPTGPIFVGTGATPTYALTTTGLSGTYDFGDVTLPASGFMPAASITDLSIDWDIAATFGPATPSGIDITAITLNMTGGGLDEHLILFDSQPGDFNGVIDGTFSADFSVSAAPVPVPAAVWLLGSGLVGLVGFRRGKQK